MGRQYVRQRFSSASCAAGDSPFASSTTLQWVVVNATASFCELGIIRLPTPHRDQQARCDQEQTRGRESGLQVTEHMLDRRSASIFTSYAGKTVESVTSLSMVCSRTFSTVAPTFDPSRSTIQTCWPCSNEPRVITLTKTPSSVAGFLSTSTQIASVSPKSPSSLSLSSIFGFFIARQALRGAKLNRCSRFLRACPCS